MHIKPKPNPRIIQLIQMIKQTPVFLLSLFLISPTFAVEFDETQTTWETMDVIHENKNSDCASEIFLNALIENGDAVNVGTPEYEVRAWARNVMSEPDVLKKILDCPEIKNTDDYKTIVFTPIEYKFPDDEYGERTITINYSTQPKILKQKLILASKLSLPNGDPNPKLMDPNDPAKYINTDPAWYAIMVVQHDSLKNFIGPNKNNTLSLKWINDNIDSIYPHGYYCTSKSAIANDKDTINKVVKQVVDIDDDTNDYYVAGDVNLEWVMYAEIAAEVALTIATVGGFEAAMVSAKSVRAFKNGKTLVKSMRNLLKFDDVKDYVKIAKQISNHSDDIAKLEKNIKNAKKYEKALEKASKGGKNAEKYRKEAEEILKSAQKIDKNITPEKLKNVDKLTDQRKALQETVKSLEQNAETMAKNSKNVEKYKESAETFADLQKYYKKLRAFKRPQTGNIITRNLKKVGSYAKTIRASQKGADIIGKAGKLGRAGMSSRSAKIGNWLLDSSLRFGTKLARFERDVSLVAGAAAFVGDSLGKCGRCNGCVTICVFIYDPASVIHIDGIDCGWCVFGVQ